MMQLWKFHHKNQSIAWNGTCQPSTKSLFKQTNEKKKQEKNKEKCMFYWMNHWTDIIAEQMNFNLLSVCLFALERRFS